MKIIFFGNTKYSLIGARIIHDALGLSQIVTIPDRPDKKGKPTPSPLKTFALENKIPVLTINKITDETIEQLKSLLPDFFVVEDFGLILPKNLLEIPKKANLNIHHSLLPKYRGPSPAPTAILAGDQQTGVTIIKMAEKVDAGDILAQVTYTIPPEETTDSLLTILNRLGAEKLIEVIKDYDHNSKQAKQQDETKATFTKMMKKEDGYIDLTNPPSPEKLDRMIRAYYPWPGVWTLLRLSASHDAKVLRDKSEGQAKKTRVKLLPENRIQVEGKKPVSLKDFYNGYPQAKEEISKLFYEKV